MRRNLLILGLYCVFLVVIIIVYSLIFGGLMRTLEGEEYSFATSVYWTITAMTTLGFGDITFTSDAGRLFSGLVTLSGVFFLLIVFPFGTISLFMAPWVERSLRYRPRVEAPAQLADHVVLCGWDAVTHALAQFLQAGGIPYVLVEPGYEQVRRLDEEGIKVVYGIPTDARVLQRVRVESARIVVANMVDTDNANLVLTVKALCDTPVVAVATEIERADLLKIAGGEHVVPLREILGGYLAVRSTTWGAMSHVVDSMGSLLFAEIPAHGTPLAGLTLAETGIREKTGVSVIGIWERGRFALPTPDTRIDEGTVMLLAGSAEQLELLERFVGENSSEDLVLIMGFGTVGRSAAGFLEREGVPYVVVDKNAAVLSEDIPEIRGARRVVQGDASRRALLEEADVEHARGLIITTNDDGANVFITLACRHLNQHIRIVVRANREENVSELYAAGADFVVSHASVGASILSNVIEGRKTIFLTEGVHIFLRTVPARLAGVTLAASRLRTLTGATLIAVQREGEEEPDLNVEPDTVLEPGATLVLVGSPESEGLFSERFRQTGGAPPTTTMPR
jgi:Trk K+ transport system NAD-binding subunit